MIEAFLIYILCAYGISNIIVYSSGPFDCFTKMRDFMDKYAPSNFGELFHCMICFPTWVGIALSVFDIFFLKNIAFTPFNISFNNDSLWYYIIPLDMFITSGTVWLINTIQETFESITERNNRHK
jgi:hypothetical protein